MEETVNRIFTGMSNIKKPQCVFIAGLLSVLMILHGRATVRNMSRYCDMSEKRFSAGAVETLTLQHLITFY